MRLVAGLIAAFAISLMGVTDASAGYLSLGIGDGAELRGDMSTRFAPNQDGQGSGDTASGRFAVGQRMGIVAVEAALSGSDVGPTQSVSLSVDLKLYKNLVGGLDFYGRGGIGKTWLEHPFAGDDAYAGRNKQLGLGLQYSVDAPVGHLGVFVDLSRQFLDLQAAGQPVLVGELDTLQIGAAVGF